MKKALILAIMVIAILAIASSVALAGGWTEVETGTAHLPNGTTDTVFPINSSWNPDVGGAPHGGFSSTTNRCRVCHAVHMADPASNGFGSSGGQVNIPQGNRIVGPTSWRLLRNQNREEECYYCHGPDGATNKQPFRDRGSLKFYGEHTLGSTIIPDSGDATAAVPGGALTCGTCHNVHAAGVVATDTVMAGLWNTTETLMANFMAARILKNNPKPNNNHDVSGENGSIAGSGGADPFTRFCADCHDKNPNWDVDTTGQDSDPDTGWSDIRRDSNNATNTTSHVQGPAATGDLEVYGKTVKVANYPSNDTYNSDKWGWKDPADSLTDFKDIVLETSPRWGCRGCHRASDQGNIDAGYEGSAWPHRTVGAKLLFDTYATGTVQDQFGTGNGDGKIIDDANRSLPALDSLCTKCHRNNGGTAYDGSETATEGVGITF